MDTVRTADGPQPVATALAKVMTRVTRSAELTGDNSVSPADDSEQQDAEERKLYRRASVWRQLVEARGKRYAECRLDNFEVRDDGQSLVVEKLRSHLIAIDEQIDAGQNVLFIGPAGTGKDHLMMALLQASVATFHSAIWVNGSSLWLQLRATFDSNYRPPLPDLCERGKSGWAFDATLNGKEQDIIRKLSTVDVLAISDPLPPGGVATDFQATTLLNICDRRYSELRPTFMTINAASREDLEARLGVPTVDRLAHGALVLACDWPSYRKGTATN